MKETNEKIIKWLRDNKIDTLDPEKQYLKIVEEVGEFARGLLKDDKELIKDAIGDIYVAVMGLRLQTRVVDYNYISYDITLIDDLMILKTVIVLVGESLKGVGYFGLTTLCLEEMAIRNNLTLKECVEHAYNEIKNRDIKIIKGVAVK